MILHACLHCQASGLYAQELGSDVTCHSCGVSFSLSGFTKVDKTAIHRIVEAARLKAEDVRQSRRLVYSGGLLLAALVIWISVSIIGIVPDTWRVVNRRFASVKDPSRLFHTIGRVAVAGIDDDGSLEFKTYFTATAIDPRGYLLTSKKAAALVYLSQAWVFIGGKRLEVQLVDVDSIADIALLKVEESLPYFFRISDSSERSATNSEVTSIGFQDTQKIELFPTESMYSMTHGTISRRFLDKIGTEWIEHSAPMTVDGGGGPLIIDDLLVGLNTNYDRGITRAVSIAPYRSKIERWIGEIERKKSGDN